MSFQPAYPSSCAVDRVPVEVWSEIFLRCLPEPRDRPCHTFDIAPLTLTHVCTRWAHIARGLHRLWSSLTITIKPLGVFPPIDEAEKWLGRSGTVPLTLVVDQQPFAPGGRNLEVVLALFAHHVQRWKHVRIHRFVPESIREAGGDWSAPLLESLELIPNLYMERHVPVDFSTLLGGTPALNSLLHCDPEIAPGSILWERLTRLVHIGHSTRVEDAFDLVRKCPQLEDLAISLSTVPNILIHPPSATTSTMTHSRLRLLRIKAEGEELETFLDHAALPSLTELSIIAPYHSPWYQSSPRAFNSFLERSGAKLAALTVSGILPGNLAAFAGNPNLQSLEALAVQGLPGDGYSIPVFTASDFLILVWGCDVSSLVQGGEGKAHLLPKLRCLRLGASRGFWKHAPADIKDALKQMRVSRRRPPADRLCAKFSLDFGPAETSETRRYLSCRH